MASNVYVSDTSIFDKKEVTLGSADGGYIINFHSETNLIGDITVKGTQNADKVTVDSFGFTFVSDGGKDEIVASDANVTGTLVVSAFSDDKVYYRNKSVTGGSEVSIVNSGGKDHVKVSGTFKADTTIAYKSKSNSVLEKLKHEEGHEYFIYNVSATAIGSETGRTYVENTVGSAKITLSSSAGGTVYNSGTSVTVIGGSGTDITNSGRASYFEFVGSHTSIANTGASVSVYATGASDTIKNTANYFYVDVKSSGASATTYNVVSNTATAGVTTIIADQFVRIENSGKADITLSGGSDTVISSGQSTIRAQGSHNVITNTSSSKSFITIGGAKSNGESGSDTLVNNGSAEISIGGAGNMVTNTAVVTINAANGYDYIVNSGTGIISAKITLGGGHSTLDNITTTNVTASIAGGYNSIKSTGDSFTVTLSSSDTLISSGNSLKADISGKGNYVTISGGKDNKVTVSGTGNYITNTTTSNANFTITSSDNHFVNSGTSVANATVKASGSSNTIGNVGSNTGLYVSITGGQSTVSNTAGINATIIGAGNYNDIYNGGSDVTINISGTHNHVSDTGKHSTLKSSGANTHVYNIGTETTISISGASGTINDAGSMTHITLSGGSGSIKSVGDSSTVVVQGSNNSISNTNAIGATFTIKGDDSSSNYFYNYTSGKATVYAAGKGSTFSNTAASGGFYISLKGGSAGNNNNNTIYNIDSASEASIISGAYAHVYDYGSATKVSLGANSTLQSTGDHADISVGGADAFVTIQGSSDTLVVSKGATVSIGGETSAYNFVTNTADASTFTIGGLSHNFVNSGSGVATVYVNNATDLTITNSGTSLNANIQAGSSHTSITNVSDKKATIVSAGVADVITNSGTASITLSGTSDTLTNSGTISEASIAGEYAVISNTATTGSSHFTITGANANFLQTGNGATTIFASGGSDTIITSGTNLTGNFYVSLSGANNTISNTANTKTTVIVNGSDNDIYNAGAGAKYTLQGTDNEVSNTGTNTTFYVSTINNHIYNSTTAKSKDQAVGITLSAGSNTVVNDGGVFQVSIGANEAGNVISNMTTSAVTIYGSIGKEEIYNKGANSFITLGGGDTLHNFSDAASVKVTIGGIDNVTNSIYNSGSSMTVIGATGSVYLDNTASGTSSNFTLSDKNDIVINAASDVTVNTGSGKDYITNTATSSTFIVGDYVHFNNSGTLATKVTLKGNSAGNHDIYNEGEELYVSLSGGGHNYASSTGASSTFIFGAGNDKLIVGGNVVSATLGTGNDSVTNTGTSSTFLFGTSNNNAAGNVYFNNSNGASDTVKAFLGTTGKATINNAGDAFYVSLNGGAGNVISNTGGADVSIVGSNKVDTIHNSAINAKVTLQGGDVFYNSGSDVTVSVGGSDKNTIYNSGTAVTVLASNTNSANVYYNSGNSSTFQVGSGADTIYNYGSSTTIQATGGANVIYNYIDAQKAVINVTSTSAAASTIHNSANDVTMTATAGNDTIYTQGSNVVIDAGSGTNRIYSTVSSYEKDDGSTEHYKAVSVKADGSVGGNYIAVYVDTSTIITGAGNDTIDSKGDNSNITAGGGNDTIYSVGDKVTIDAGAGANYIYSTVIAGKDNNGDTVYYNNLSVKGGDNDDYIAVYNPGSTIEAGKGNDTVVVYGTSWREVKPDDPETSRDSGTVITFASETNTTNYVFGLSKNDIIGVNVGSDVVTVTAVAGSKDVEIKMADNSTIILNNARNQLIHISNTSTSDVTYFNSVRMTDYTVRNDNQSGTTVADFINITADNDSDQLSAGEGNDYIFNQSNNKKVLGGTGDDTIQNEFGTKVFLNGGAGNDLILTNNKSNDGVTIMGGRGDDTVRNDAVNYYSTVGKTYTTTSIDNNGTITVTNHTYSINNTSKAASDKVGSKTDTITLKGGRTFIYREGDGNDLIEDFATGNGGDTLRIVGNYETVAGQYDNKDAVIVNVGVGSITLVGSKTIGSANISSLSASEEIGYATERGETAPPQTGLVSDEDDTDSLTYNANSTIVYIKSGIGQANSDITMGASGYASTVSIIDATQVTLGVKITGRENSGTTIHGGYGNDTIISGKNANDYIYGGGGENVFVVTPETGSDTIVGFTTNDVIKMSDTNTIFIQGKTIAGGGIELQFGSGTSLDDANATAVVQLVTVKGSGGVNSLHNMNIRIRDGNNSETQLQYGVTSYTVTAKDAPTLDFRTTPDIKTINANDHATLVSNDEVNEPDYSEDTEELKGNFAKRIIYAGREGSSIVSNSTGQDTIIGGNGKDTISVSGKYSRFVIYGGDESDRISVTGDDAKNTVYGGKGNDIIYGGSKTKNTYVIKPGDGKDTIEVMSSDDVIYMSETYITGGAYANNAVTFTLKGSDTDTLVIKNVDKTSGKYITIIQSETSGVTTTTQLYGSNKWVLDNKEYTNDDGVYSDTLGINDKIDLTYNAAVVTLDASKVKVGDDDNAKSPHLHIIGNSGNNYLVASQSTTTLYGAGGNDTLVGSSADTAGAVTFVYKYGENEGNDVIDNYRSASDTILLGDPTSADSNTQVHALAIKNSDMNVEVKNGNVIIKVMSGTEVSGSTLTIKDGEEQAITFQYGSDTTNTHTYKFYADNKFVVDQYNSATLLSDTGTYYTAQDISVDHTYISAKDFDGNSGVSIAAVATSKVTIIGSKNDDTLVGSTGNDSIVSTQGKNVIIGGKGNDTLVSSETGASNTFVFSLSADNGTNVIVGYNSDTDKIQLVKGLTISKGEVKSDDVTLTLSSGTKAVGTVKLNDAKGKPISVITVDGTQTLLSSSQIYGGDSISADSATMFHAVYPDTNATADNATKTFVVDATANASIKVIEASNTTAASSVAWSLVGNAGDNTIIAGPGGATIEGGKGTDSLIAGEGSDVFIIGATSGKKIIHGYNAASDTIILASGNNGSIKSITAGSGDDSGTLIFTLSNGTTVNVEHGEGQEIRFGKIDKVDDNEVVKYIQSDGTTFSETAHANIYYGSTIISAAGNYGHILNNNNTSELSVALSTSVKTIDVSDTKVSSGGANKAWSVTGNAGDNSIVGGAGNDTFRGGKGKDTLVGGGGSNVFIFGLDEGANVISDYNSTDTILLDGASTTISASAVKGNDVVFTIGNNKGTITVTNAAKAKTNIRILGSDGVTSTQVYGLTNWQITNSDGTLAQADNFTGMSDVNLTANSVVVTLDASVSRTTVVNITGNSKNNYLIAGQSDTTLYGGSGSSKDTLDGGTSTGTKVTFVYGVDDGADVILNYDPYRKSSSEGDIIKLAASHTLLTDTNHMKITGDDVLFTVVAANDTTKSVGTINVKGGKGLIRYQSGTTVATLDAINQSDWYAEDQTGTIDMYGSGENTIKTYFDAISRRTNTTNSNTSVIMTATTDKVTMIGGAGSDTFVIGSKTATLKGNGGNDVFYFTDSGTEKNGAAYVILDYSSETGNVDYIQLGASSTLISAATVSGEKVTLDNGNTKNNTDIKFTVQNGNAKSTILVKNVVDAKTDSETAITFLHGDGSTTTQLYAQTAVTLQGATYVKDSKFDASANSLLKNIYATKDAGNLHVIGNANGNVISVAGDASTAKQHTLDGGAGNDTIYGATVSGASNTFVISAGNDIIYGYNQGSNRNVDIIYSADGKTSIKSLDSNNNDLIITTGSNGKVTVVGAARSKITFSDTTGSETVIYYGDEKVTLANSDKDKKLIDDVLDVAKSSKVKTIDASSYSDALKIVGNSNANTITAGQAGGTIVGGGGNDVISLGSSSDTVYFTAGDGADVVKNFDTASDTIVLAPSTTFVSAVAGTGANSSTLTLTIGEYVKGTGSQSDTFLATPKSGGTIKLESLAADGGVNVVSYKLEGGEIASETVKVYFSPSIKAGADTFDVSKSLSVVTIQAGESTKEIIGNSKANVIYTSNTAVTVTAGAGNDTIVVSTDTRTEEAGQTFVFNTTNVGSNVIENYNSAKSDVISLGAGMSLMADNNLTASNFRNGNAVITIYSGTSSVGTVTLAKGKVSVVGGVYTGDVSGDKDYILNSDKFIEDTDVSDSLATVESDKTYIDASARVTNENTNIYVQAKADNVVIIGGKHNNTLEAAKNATLTGGDGFDTFYYSDNVADNKGSYVITDYNAESDVILLGNSEVVTSATATKNGNTGTYNIKLQVQKGNSNAGTITVKDVTSATKISTIYYDTIIGATHTDTQIFTATSTNIAKTDNATYFNASANTNLLKITAEDSFDSDLYVVGNAKNNTINVANITASDKHYTLSGGAGNDVLSATSKGTTTFVVGSGNDVIYGYKASDIIYIGGDSVKSGDVVNGNLVLSVGKGKATLVGAGDEAITFNDANNASYTSRFFSAATITVKGEFLDANSEIDLTNSDKVKNIIAASSLDSGLSVIGNKNANSIVGSTHDDTIDGGSGNDTFTGNGGHDTFVVNKGTGNKTITDFKAMSDSNNSDTILLGSSTTFVSSAYSNKTLTLTISELYSDTSKGLTTKGSSKITLNDIESDTKILIQGSAKAGDNGEVETESVTVYGGTSYKVKDETEGAVLDFSKSWGVTTIDASAQISAVHIIGNKNANRIYASGTAVTLAGGLGNDTLYGDSDSDKAITYVYNADGTSHDGNDVIVNYKDSDKLVFTGDASIVNDSFSVDKNGNVKVQVYTTNASGSTVKAGVITLNDAVNTNVKYKLESDNDFTDSKVRRATDYVIVENELASGRATLAVDSDDATENKKRKAYTLIDASSEYKGEAGVWITPNTGGKATVLGSSKADTIEGRGKLTIDGGDGNDVFLFDTSIKGAAVEIINYSETDLISLGTDVAITAIATVKGKGAEGAAVKLSLTKTTEDDSGRTVKENATVTIRDAGDTKIQIAQGEVTTKVAYASDKLTVANGDGETIDVSKNKSIKNIDASNATGTNYIIGNALANSIVGGGSSSAVVTIDGGAGNDTIKGETSGVVYSLFGGAGNDVLSVGGNAGAGSTLDGGAGNDTLYGGTGKDYFVANAGNNIVVGYESSTDVVVLTGNASVRSANINKTTGAVTFSAGSKKITINKVPGADSVDRVEFVDESGTTQYVYYGQKSASVGEEAVTDVNLTNSTNVTMATAKDDKGYKITAHKGGVTMVGGEGNDTLVGAAGKDMFVQSGGDDVIVNYTAGKDKISLTGSITAATLVGGTKDNTQSIELTTDNGKITVQDAVTTNSNSKITKIARLTILKENELETTREYGVDYINITNKDYTLGIGTDSYGVDLATNTAYTGVVAVGGSKAPSKLVITGNDRDNSLVGGAKDDTIYGGTGGNNTLTGGKGNDYFVHQAGSTYITDYAKGDVISISGSVADASLSGSNLVMTLSDNSTITLKGGKNKEVTVKEGESQSAHVYGNTNITNLTDNVKLNDDVWAKHATVVSAKSAVTIDGTGKTDPLKLTGSTGADTLLSGSASATISGGAGNDVITVTNGGKADGGAGDDTITFSGAGNVVGGAGNDKITVASGNDSASVDGGAGNDTINFTANGGKVSGGAGDDKITVEGGSNVTVDGGAGNDEINFNANGGKIVGGAGNDKITVGGSGDVTLEAGAGNDNIELTNGSAIVRYGGGNDTITGFSGSNRLILSGTKYNYDVDNKRIKISNSAYIYIDLAVTTDSVAMENIVTSSNKNVTLTAIDSSGKKIVSESDEYAASKAWFLDDDDNYTSNDLTPTADDIFATNSIDSLLKPTALGDVYNSDKSSDVTDFSATTYSNGADSLKG